MKAFLEEYGVVVVAAIVIMIAVVFGTPYGQKLRGEITNTTNKVTEKLGEGLEYKEPYYGLQLEASDVVPDGCKYIAADGTEYNPGDNMPDVVTGGDQFIDSGYNYTYYDQAIVEELNERYGKEVFVVGWNVRVKYGNRDKTEYTENFYEIINDEPVTSMSQTFYGCENLTTTPKIPSSVTNMEGTFFACKNLETELVKFSV